MQDFCIVLGGQSSLLAGEAESRTTGLSNQIAWIDLVTRQLHYGKPDEYVLQTKAEAAFQNGNDYWDPEFELLANRYQVYYPIPEDIKNFLKNTEVQSFYPEVCEWLLHPTPESLVSLRHTLASIRTAYHGSLVVTDLRRQGDDILLTAI